MDKNKNEQPTTLKDEKMSVRIGEWKLTHGKAITSASHDVLIFGDSGYIKENIDFCAFSLVSEFQFPLPLREDTYKYDYYGKKFTLIYQRINKEEYSTSDIVLSGGKAKISRIIISGKAYNELIDTIPKKNEQGNFRPLCATEIVNAFIHLVHEQNSITVPITEKIAINIIVSDLRDKEKIIKITIPYNGIIKYFNDIEVLIPENHELTVGATKHLVCEKITSDKKDIISSNFTDELFQLTHKYAFYIRQTPKVFYSLGEEDIRDILLVLYKSYFTFAEGEAFNYDGKSDFKVVNKDNPFEYVIGELKVWNGEESYNQICMQTLKKHATSQEKELYMIFINRNKENIWGKIHNLLEQEEAIDKSTIKRISPNGSIEEFYVMNAMVNERSIPLKVGVLNTYYKNV